METYLLLFFEKKSNIKFKSYYVVWKQTHTKNNTHANMCLNRTMQYGNSYGK